MYVPGECGRIPLSSVERLVIVRKGRHSLGLLYTNVPTCPRRGGNMRKATKGTTDMSKVVRTVSIAALGCAALGLLAAPVVQHYYCKYCGLKTTSVNSLTSSSCQRHPNGPGKGRHALYEGGEKATYVCKYCGLKSTSIASLTSSKCQRHPSGPAKGRHEPAL